MKTTKLFNLTTITLLSSTVLLSGTTVLAEETNNFGSVTETQTDVTVGFTTSTSGEDGEEIEVVPPVDPENPIVIPPVDPETNRGPLTIAYVPTMSFGNHEISTQDKEYNMLAETHELEDGSGDAPYVSFAQIQDTRGTNNGWTLQVSMSDFISNSENDTLVGAEILFDANGTQLVTNEEDYTGEAITTTLSKLVPNSGSTDVMKAKEGSGSGTTSVVWGDYDQMTADADNPEIEAVENASIKLAVPGKTVKDATTYTATLTWELSAGVDNK